MLPCPSLQRFDFDIFYNSVKEVIIADCLSRAPAEARNEDILLLPEIDTLEVTFTKCNAIRGCIAL